MNNTTLKAYPTPAFDKIRVSNLRNLGVLDTPADPYFDKLIHLASKALNMPMAALSLVDQDRQWFKAHTGLGVQETPREISFCTYTILHPYRPLAVPDATLSPIFKDNPLVTSKMIRSYLGIPINSPDFELTIGSLCVIDSKPREFTSSEVDVLVGIADLIQDRLKQMPLKLKTG